MIRVQVDIPEERLRALIGGAHIGYWADMSRTEWLDREALVMDVHEQDPTPGARYHIDRNVVIHGLSIMAERYPQRFAEVLSDRKWDGTTGDLLIQCALFGEEKYA